MPTPRSPRCRSASSSTSLPAAPGASYAVVRVAEPLAIVRNLNASLLRLSLVAAALTLLALLSWWQSEATRARALNDRALELDPEHRLARLLDDALATGLRPGWVRRPA